MRKYDEQAISLRIGLLFLIVSFFLFLFSFFGKRGLAFVILPESLEMVSRKGLIRDYY